MKSGANIKILIIMLGVVLPAFVFSQFSDSWINYNQQYYKFKIYKEGIYRIYKQNLLDAGFPAGSINPKNIQIFRNGKEIPIYIYGEDDLIFNDGDYIEFYAYPNDGTLDSNLYESQADQTNPYISLINDTATYFITWKNDNSHKLRYEIFSDTSQYTEINTCLQTIISNYKSGYYLGQNSPTYTAGEGWFDNTTYYNGHDVVKNISLQNPVSSPATAEICFVGTPASTVVSNIYHHTLVSLNGTTVIDTVFSGYNFVRETVEFTPASSLEFRFTANYSSSYIDRQAVAYIKIDYERNANFNNDKTASFYLPATNYTRTLLINDFDGGNLPVALDYKNNKKIIPQQLSTTSYKINIPPAEHNNEIYLSNASEINTVSNIEKIEMPDLFQSKNYELIIITSKKLSESANQYKTYRESQGYNTLIVYYENLENEFAYGIGKHPLAIRNFLKKVYYTYDTLPKAVFIIGKAIHNRTCKNNSSYFSLNLVPTWGDPSSDNLLSVKLDTTSNDISPQIPIGRISATTNEEVINYLNKVKTYESAPKSEWMKQVLHLGGGSTQSQQDLFESYLNEYKNIIEDTLFGGNVTTYIKHTSLPISNSAGDSIRTAIDSGVTLLTFFGHGSSSGFDQNIDYPQNYNNTGKYPAIISNSCLTADIHLPPPERVSEQWVFTPDKGSIAFMGSGDLGYVSMLHLITLELYKQISYANYGNYLGVQILEAIKNFLNGNELNPYYEKMAYDFTLLGDPLLKLNYFDKPDLTIKPDDIRFTPTTLSTAVDSFQITFAVTNLGRATTDTFLTAITREANNETTVTYTTHFGCNYKDTVTITLPSTINGKAGINNICFYTDQVNNIEESDENNNNTCLDFLVNSDFVYPVFPYEYAIYPYDTLTLKACTGNPLNFNGQVVFQIDTNDYFTSPFLYQAIVNISPGGVVKWQLPFHLTDSTVYYWRVAKLNSDNWKNSSFIYIPGKTGWSQAHFYQFSKDNYTFIDFNRTQRKFDFTQTPVQLFCRNIGSPQPASFYDIKYFIGNIQDYSCCGSGDAIMVAVFDSTFLVPWESNYGNFGHRNYPKCPSRDRNDRYFIFSTDSLSIYNMVNFVYDSVPNNDYILIYTWRNGHFSEWTEDEYQKLENLGATDIRTIPDNYPYIFFTQKGHSGSSISVVGNSPTDTITLNHNISTNFFYGKVTSPLIGPVINLNSVHWHFKQFENNSDSTVFHFLEGENDTLIFSKQTGFDTTCLYNSNYYRLSFFTKDTIYKTPSQPVRWQLIYDEAPETAINPAKGFYLNTDSLQQGEVLYFAVATENIGQKDMDSLVVRYSLIDTNNSVTILENKKLRPHPVGDVIIDTLDLSTKTLLGNYRLRVEYNPVNEATGTYYQLEQYHFNNIAEINFTVYPDNENPVLDVTFDGRHIINYESVAEKPEIKISLRDENDFFLLDDTTAFEIYLYKINGNSSAVKQIYFSNNDESYSIDFYPATSFNNNYCYAIYKPELTPGVYKLAVQGIDKTGNLSGDNYYEIYFVVDSTFSIENFYTYPNPFHNKIYFAFTIKNSLPDEFYIKIFDNTGRLVKTLNVKENGIYIGDNVINVYWDGTNNFGQFVSTGVYFYKIIASYRGNPVFIQTYNSFNKGKIIYFK